MNQQLQDFYNHLNTAVLTTNDFADGTRYRKREKVAQFAYCGLNPMYRSYLSLDLDFPGAAHRFEELHVPVPTIVTTNRANGHCHYLYRLVTPVAYHDKARSQPQEYFEALQDEMTRRLGADAAFTHTLTKNPLHDRWIVETFPAEYHLSDFAEYFELPPRKTAVRLRGDGTSRGRNHELFNTLRFWAYGAVHSHTSEETWLTTVQHQATAINACFARPLPFKEVRDTAKTTGLWAWKHRHELHVCPKVLSFTDETATERMQAGAEYTNQKRRQKAQDFIRAAVEELLPLYGNELGTRLLATHTGQNIKTVRKYLPAILHAVKTGD
jgi:hypothetical protein